jgi:hypothetical protein
LSGYKRNTKFLLPKCHGTLGSKIKYNYLSLLRNSPVGDPEIRGNDLPGRIGSGLGAGDGIANSFPATVKGKNKISNRSHFFISIP